jgi:threonine/homoserine efflux transporter RhtA
VRIAELRAFSAAVILLPILAIVDRRALLVPRDTVGPVAVFGTCLVLVNSTYYLAIARLPVGVALTIQYLGPLLVLVLRRHRVTRALWVAAATAVAGAALVSGAFGGLGTASVSGLGLAVASAFAFAGYLVAGEAVGRRLGVMPSVAWGFTAATLVYVFVQPWWSFPFGQLAHSGTAWRAGVVCILGTVIPFLCMVGALRLVTAGPAGVLATAEPGFGALFARVILGESLSVAQVGGLALVTAGVASAQLAGARPPAAVASLPPPAAPPS